MFLALKGPNFNGNQFALQALEAEASFVVVDEPPKIPHSAILVVENGLEALQKLAHHHRMVWGKEVIAICGSNGKTTTKELISCALGAQKTIFSTPGNLNNHIGVPLCLLQLEEKHEMAIIEMGANHPGEIAELCEIAAPNSGLITNIGKDHLEGFGSIENTAQANGELFDYLQKNKGLAFINSTDLWNEKLKSKVSQTFSFPAVGDNFEIEMAHSEPFISLNTKEGKTMETGLLGNYNFQNLACALAVAAFYQIQPGLALAAVCAYRPANNRSQVIQTAKNFVISDAYNANPSSVFAALENLKSMKGASKWALLGDMLELGKDSEKEHSLLGKWAIENGDIYFAVVGPEMKAFSNACPSAFYFTEKQAFEIFLEKEKIQNSIVLLKGSRGMKMETAIPFL